FGSIRSLTPLTSTRKESGQARLVLLRWRYSPNKASEPRAHWTPQPPFRSAVVPSTGYPFELYCPASALVNGAKRLSFSTAFTTTAIAAVASCADGPARGTSFRSVAP